MKIPFNRPFLFPESRKHLSQVIASQFYAGNGPYSFKAEILLNNLTKSQRHFLTPSCTHALELAFQCLDLQPGDEVIIPSFAFTSCANAVVVNGATPVFVDVTNETYCIDPKKVEKAINKKTRAILLIHYGGVASDLDAFQELVLGTDIVLVEDNAHGLGGFYKDLPLGSFGVFASHSFHETKNIQCGEGGSLAVNDNKFLERIEIAREKGTDRTKFSRGQVDKYTWQSLGSSWIQSEFLSAILLGQLENFNELQIRREVIWTRYYNELGGWSNRVGVKLPLIPSYSKHTSHIFYLVFDSQQSRDNVRQKLYEAGILAVFHYQPLHLSPAGRKFGRAVGSFQATLEAANNLLRLPIWYGLSDENQTYILDVLMSSKK